MKLAKGPFTPLGAAAFFLFAWVVQRLFNAIVVGHFGLLLPLSYWQAASLLFLFMLLFAWSGWASGMGWPRGWTFRIEAGLFFLFAWFFQMLFNSLIVGYFGLLKPLSYLQAAGLLFLVALLTAWLGFAAAPSRSVKLDLSDLGQRIRDEIKQFIEEW